MDFYIQNKCYYLYFIINIVITFNVVYFYICQFYRDLLILDEYDDFYIILSLSTQRCCYLIQQYYSTSSQYLSRWHYLKLSFINSADSTSKASYQQYHQRIHDRDQRSGAIHYFIFYLIRNSNELLGPVLLHLVSEENG